MELGTFILSLLENPKQVLLVVFALILVFAGVVIYIDIGNNKEQE